MKKEDFLRPFLVPPGTKISLKRDYDPGYKADYVKKEDAAKRLQEGIERLVEQQEKLYAQDTYPSFA